MKPSSFGALVVVGAAAALFWAPAGDSGRNALTISKISATFSEPDRATTYSVSPDALAVAQVRFAWTLDVTTEAAKVDGSKGLDIACNKHDATDGQSFVWHHGNKGDPVHDDDCNHDLQGKWGTRA